MLHDEYFQHDEGRLANQEKVLEVLNSLKLAEQRAIKMLAQSLGWPRTLCSALHFFCRCLFFWAHMDLFVPVGSNLQIPAGS